tara:strand:- start:845 stop:1714 length:870 start_codon:yes stop_codon:yes gene_type:complete
MTDFLSVSGLNFSWGENHVLKDVEFTMQRNEVVAILGVNGAGKSTLIKCLNKILTPKSGKILIEGNDLSSHDLVSLAKVMSYVPQTVRSSFSMNVFDVALIGRRPHIRWRISQRDRDFVSQTLRYLGLEDFAFRRFNQLSGGERQRVIIAKAIVQNPDLYLFDEPTSDLDLKNQVSIMKRIRHLVSPEMGDKSALIAIHDINLAARFADKIILFDDGKVKSYGKPEDVLTEQSISDVFGVSSMIIPREDDASKIHIIINNEIEEREYVMPKIDIIKSAELNTNIGDKGE